MSDYLVRIGFAGDVFLAASSHVGVTYDRGDDALVQTPRGVELAEILSLASAANAVSSHPATGSGVGGEGLTILRKLTPDDRLLVERLQRHKIDAIQRCQQLLAASQSSAVLLDVDQLFDGNTLVLHFLGPVDALGREITDEIVAQYESTVQSIRLSELMTHGCGPDCGTESGGGCGTSGGCVSCAISGACKT